MVTCLRAPNPSPMTLDGTNGYAVRAGPGTLVAIDPGVDDTTHIDAFLAIAQEARATYAAILVTHGHPDHYPGALALRRATGAPIYAHPDATYGADRALDEGMHLAFEAATFRALYAPGHARDHLVFWLEQERALFTGDVVIGTGTVVIAPPAGDMRQYQASLERLLRDYGHAAVLYCGHGPSVRDPRAKLVEYIEHRRLREAQIVAALAARPATIPALVGAMYAGLSATLHPAAARQVLAYLLALQAEGRVSATPMARRPTAQEALVLEPDLTALGTSMDRAVARAELGLDAGASEFSLYSLVA